ncbi:MAG: type I-E CRISPR-associated protein Cas7/Cse4/CasC [Luteolibacter sp.]|uniref:type I-E CRISPR-associated protein Cas7/Cse4/CasC n=1 Tax=Luteolibacter sp. TaxID=1962973 RepID=UPI003263D996
MNLIELHILQSFPVSCLNRDDVGSPKSAVFGGVTRARLSSQSLKRAVRLNFNESHYGDAFHTTRTKLAHEKLVEDLIAGGLSLESAEPLALEVMSKLVDQAGAAKAKVDRNGRMNMPALIWLSPSQLQAAAAAILANKDTIETATAANSTTDKAAKKAAEKALKDALTPVTKAIQKAGISDAADIAFFGRMVANDPSLNVEGASMFSHALSTHSSSNEIDFYTAVDDVKQRDGENDETEGEEAGAGMIGTLEFNSATYYRYTAINLDLLFDKKHLVSLPAADRKEVLRSFIKALLIAIPGARQNSMNAATLPFEVLGIRKIKGQPLQLANAFEAPVKANGKGLQSASLTAMKEHLEKLEKTWGSLGEKLWLTEIGLDSFLDQLLDADV